MQYGFEKFRFDRLVSVTHHANRRSVRVMEKLGMTFDKRFTHKEVEVVCYANVNPFPTAQREGSSCNAISMDAIV
jgi:RimJ/RimL family protein N-acetyltransferase